MGCKKGFSVPTIFGSWIIRLVVTAIIIFLILFFVRSLIPKGPTMEDHFKNFFRKVERARRPGYVSQIVGTGKVSFSVSKIKGAKKLTDIEVFYTTHPYPMGPIIVPVSKAHPSGVILQIYGEKSGEANCIRTLNKLNDSNKFLKFPENLNEAYSLYGEKYILCMATLDYTEVDKKVKKGVKTFSGDPKSQATDLCKELGNPKEFLFWNNSMICKPIPGQSTNDEPVYLNVEGEGPLKWISGGPNNQINFASIEFERSSYDSNRINMSYIRG